MFEEFGNLGIEGELESLFGVSGDHRFECKPEHAGEVVVFNVFGVLGEPGEDGPPLIEGEALEGRGEVEPNNR